jgi:hypothetical protein
MSVTEYLRHSDIAALAVAKTFDEVTVLLKPEQRLDVLAVAIEKMKNVSAEDKFAILKGINSLREEFPSIKRS